jgi:hypothetical protein
MLSGWVWTRGMRWSTERIGILHEGENLVDRDPGLVSGPQRTAYRCWSCRLVVVNYEDRGPAR